MSKTVVLATVMLVVLAVALAPAWAAGGESPAGTNPTRSNDSKEGFDAHNPTVRYHFADGDMDFTFGFFLGTTSNGGCEIGEAMYVASQVKEGDAASWQAEWIKMADRVAARAEATLAAGHKSSAVRQLLRASNYYRASIVSMMPDDPRVKQVAARSRSLFRRAGALMDPPVETFEIPFEGTVLPGYFRRADNSGRPRPTLFAVGGGETFAEDLWFHVGPQTSARGYNFVTVDLPGQGLLPWQGKFFRPAMHVPISAVITHVLARAEVDPARLALYGISGGGGFAPQAAMNDPRIKAVGVTAAVTDAERLFATMPVATTTAQVVKGFSSFHRNVVKLVAYRWGVSMDDVPGLVKANHGFTFDPARVPCPALLLVGAGEYADQEVQRQQKECMDRLPHPKKRLVVTPQDAGASSHCIGENRSLVGEILFDWLDEVFAPPTGSKGSTRGNGAGES